MYECEKNGNTTIPNNICMAITGIGTLNYLCSQAHNIAGLSRQRVS
jgi:hypothetical protein